jgi:hypothetical protein
MYALPIAAQLAGDSTAAIARSALPDAPKLTEPTRPARTVGPIRRVSAVWLHRLAHLLASEQIRRPADAHAGR